MAYRVVVAGETAGADDAPVADEGGEERLSSPDSSAMSPAMIFTWKRWLETGGALAGVYLAVRLLTRFPDGDWLSGLILLLALVMLGVSLARAGLVSPLPARTLLQGPIRRDITPPGLLVGFAALATLLAGVRRWDLDQGAVGLDVIAPWLLGIALFAVAAWWPELSIRRSIRTAGGLLERLPAGWGWAPWLGLIALAAVPRLVMLDRYPAFITGDEGQYLMMAVQSREGTLSNLFATGWLEVPVMYPAVSGWVASVFGDGLAAHRTLGGLVGTIGVLGTWRLGRHLVGEWTAWAGAALLATLPFHLLFSRSALNHVVDPAVLVVSLLFLWRAVRQGHRGEAFLSGLVVGIGWYGYWGARAFPLVVIILLVITLLDRRLGIRGVVRVGVWWAIGFVATTLPLLTTFQMVPDVFWGRRRTTSIAAMHPDITERGELFRIYLDNLREAVFLPFIDSWQLFYLHHAPFLGWPMALLVAVGCAAWGAGIVTGRAWLAAAWLVVPWAVLTLGIAQSHPVQSQRFVGVAPVWMLLAGCGAVALVRWFAWPVRRDRWVEKVLVGGLVLSVGLSSQVWMMERERVLENWGDPRTLAAWDLGWRLANSNDPSAPVLYAGAPHMFINDWASLHFLVPDANVQDVEGEAGQQLSVPEGGLLVFGPERVEEMCAIVAASPGLEMAEIRASNGRLLYVTLADEGIEGWSAGASPEGTTYTVLAHPPCQQASGS
jgi:hypothetical protein